MGDFLKKVGDQIKDFYMSLSAGKRVALIMTALGLTTGIASMLFWAGGSDYQTLAQNLASEDATSIMRLLREKKIPFKIEADGKTIKVPPEAMYDLRLELATMGMAQSNIVGYEVFDKQSFGTTSFVQKINQKRALEGELMRTINELKGVKRSRVHLAIPTATTFKEDQKKATASVVIDLENGLTLAEKQLAGVQHLVASAIEGMDINDVTITDSSGKVLSKNTNDPLAHQTATMLEFQQKYESDTERKIQEILNRVVGEGKIVAKVAMDLDFTQSQETQTQYDSEGSAMKSHQKESQVNDGSRPVAMGAPGAASNTPGPSPASTTAEVRSNNQKAFETTNWAVPEKVVRSQKAPYTVKRMSVAVMIDGLYQKDATKEGAPAVYQKWSDEKLAEFKAVVSNAVALDPKRGDTIEIKNMEFRHEDVDAAEAQIAAFEKKKMIANLLQYGLIGLVIGFFFFFVVRPFVKWLTDNTVESMESFLPKTIEELEKIQSTDGGDLATLEEAIPVIVDKVDPEKVEGEMIKEKVVTLIENNPQKAAMILHEWLQAPSVKAAAAAALSGNGKKPAQG